MNLIQNIIFVITKSLIDIFTNILTLNAATLIISLVTCVLLYLVKVYVNERYKAKLPAPLPIELFVVIAGTAISYAADFSGNHQVKVIGAIESGFPAFKFPSLSIFAKVFSDSLSIAIVSFAM
jgi:MFS superfamily sulfate permease-like transporter